MNMTLIPSREVKKKMYSAFVASTLMKFFFHFTRWNKSHVHGKNLNILYLYENKETCISDFDPHKAQNVRVCHIFQFVRRSLCSYISWKKKILKSSQG